MLALDKKLIVLTDEGQMVECSGFSVFDENMTGFARLTRAQLDQPPEPAPEPEQKESEQPAIGPEELPQQVRQPQQQPQRRRHGFFTPTERRAIQAVMRQPLPQIAPNRPKRVDYSPTQAARAAKRLLAVLAPARRNSSPASLFGARRRRR